MRTFVGGVIACLLPLAAHAGPAADATASTTVSLAHCLDVSRSALGGDALHLEFESQGGEPFYEFIIGKDDVEYYVACSARIGLLQDVDVSVGAQDGRFAPRARVDEARAREVALAQYPGEVEEVKRFLTADGRAQYEVDVEIADPAAGEFNVWIDAETGALVRVEIEYWEIGRPTADAN